MLSFHSIELPSDIFVTRILPLLDRRSFDILATTSKEFHEGMKAILPPWPDRLVAKDHLCRMKSFALNNSGTVVACGCSDGRVRLWHLLSGEQKPLEGHWPDEAVHNVVFGNQKDELLASASTDHTVLLWNLETISRSSKKASIKAPVEPKKIHSSHVAFLHFSRDNSIIFVGHHSSETIQFWNVSSVELVGTFSVPSVHVSIQQVAQGYQETIASQYRHDADSKCIGVWNIEDCLHETIRCGLHPALVKSKIASMDSITY